MIRVATAADIPALIEIGRRFHAASHYAEFGARFSETKLRETLQAQIGSDIARVLVAESEGVVVGTACAVITSMYMSDDPMAIELYWWMDPVARGGLMGIRMKERLEDWAQERGAHGVVMSSLALIDDSPADEIFPRRGYRHVETAWMKGLPTWQP